MLLCVFFIKFILAASCRTVDQKKLIGFRVIKIVIKNIMIILDFMTSSEYNISSEGVSP